MNNVIFNKTVTKLFTVLKKYLLLNLNHKSYLKAAISGNTHRKCSVRKDILGNVPKFTGKHLCQISFLKCVFL